MEILKSKKVIIYLVVVLLISTGISYAYFTATSTVNGKGSSLTSKTADPATATVEAEGIVNFNDNDMYPGHKELVKVKVTGTGANEPILFDLIFKGTNTFNSNIKYKVYKTTTDVEASITCNKKAKVENGKQLLYEECIESLSSLGNNISTGSITKSETEEKITLKQNEVILTKPNGNSLYYYIVIEYENVTDISKAQNDDKESLINGKITIEESKTKYEKPTVTLTASTNQNTDNNDWYTSVSISGTIEGTGTKYTGQYCISTSATCEPTNNLTITNKNITAVSFQNNEKEQVLCMKLRDEYEQEINTCSEKYKVDNEVPTVRITNTSSTTNSITINVSASDTHSKVKTYHYSIDNGATYQESTESTKTISVSEYKTYNIRVYVLDTAGNKSTEATTTVTVKNPYAARDQILAKATTGTGTPDFSKTSCASNCGEKTNGLYSAQDDDGTTWYFRGTVDDNWVKFGRTDTSGPSSGEPIWWRIIRINGDGSVRMIYAGTGSSAPNTTGTGTQLSSGTTGFAPTGSKSTCAGEKADTYCYKDNKFVGYMFNGDKGTASTDYNSAHNISGSGTKSNSNVKTVLDEWYNANLTDEATYLSDDAGFCGDRSSTISSGTPAKEGGYGKTVTYYGAYVRLVNKNNPTFKCTYKENNLYTTNKASEGNKALQYPIGLITADEVAFAGGVNGTINTSYYLCTNQIYWTMSPGYFDGTYARVFGVFTYGDFGNHGVSVANGVRPVINLKADITLSGSGTTSSPYTVS